MDRAEFLNRLEAQLLDVPQAEREEALQYYEDYLNDAGDAGDFDILQELGTPEKVADSIRNGLRQESSDAGERSGQADENWQDSSRTGQLGDSGYFSENGYVDREPQKEELQRVKQPACGDRSDADWQSTDSDPEDDSSAARRKQSPVWLWIADRLRSACGASDCVWAACGGNFRSLCPVYHRNCTAGLRNRLYRCGHLGADSGVYADRSVASGGDDWNRHQFGSNRNRRFGDAAYGMADR